MQVNPITYSMKRDHTGNDPTPSKPLSFPLFPAVPSELRQRIWRFALLSRTPSIVSVQVFNNAGGPRLSFRGIGGTSIASVALVCVEAFEEWSHISRYFLGALLPRQCIPQTIFLLQSPLRATRLLRTIPTPLDHSGLPTQIRHVSFVLMPNTTLTGIFSALVSFPRLKTIILIMPSCLSQDDVQLDSPENSCVAKMLTELLNDPSPDGQFPEDGHFSLLLRGQRPSQAVMEFYARDDAPRVKFLTPKCGEGRYLKKGINWSFYLS